MFEILVTITITLIGSLLGLTLSANLDETYIKSSLFISMLSFLIVSLMRFFGPNIFALTDPQVVKVLHTISTFSYFALILPLNYFAGAWVQKIVSNPE